MAKLVYSAITSADGYVEDAAGRFGWAAPSPEVHRFVNDLQRPIGTYLYGRRMYETMLYWETADTVPGQPAVVREFSERSPAMPAAIWNYWAHGGSHAVRSTSDTAPRQPEHAAARLRW